MTCLAWFNTAVCLYSVMLGVIQVMDKIYDSFIRSRLSWRLCVNGMVLAWIFWHLFNFFYIFLRFIHVIEIYIMRYLNKIQINGIYYFQMKDDKNVVQMHNVAVFHCVYIDGHIKTRKTMTNDFVCNNSVADDQYRI